MSNCSIDNQNMLLELLDIVDQAVYILAPCEKHRTIYANSKLSELTSLVSGIDSQNDWTDFIFQQDKPVFKNHIDKCISSHSKHVAEYRLISADGSTKWFRDTAIAKYCGERLHCVTGILVEITELKQAQHDLRRTQMLQAVGRIATGVIHEINTPIQFIGNNVEFLETAFNQIFSSVTNKSQKNELQANCPACDVDYLQSEIPLAISQTKDGIERVKSIIVAMKEFSHLDERRLVLANINRMLQNTATLLKNDLKQVAELKMELESQLPEMMLYRDELNQVFMNLLVNAIDSIHETIELGNQKRGLITMTTLLQGSTVKIQISDTGTGIPEHVHGRIFEHLFTTKPQGKGTGQGLYIARSIVAKHCGTIGFETQTGSGTTFTIKMPLVLPS